MIRPHMKVLKLIWALSENFRASNWFFSAWDFLLSMISGTANILFYLQVI